MSGVEAHRSVSAGLIVALPRLERFALVLCRPPLEPEELIQATCERALQKQSQFAAGTNLNAWLFSVMHSIWKNNLRQLSTERSNLALATVGSDSVDGERIAVDKIAVSEVLTALRALSPEHAAALNLVYLDGLSYEAAAAVLEIPRGTLESRIARGRVALGRVLEGSVEREAADQKQQRMT